MSIWLTHHVLPFIVMANDILSNGAETGFTNNEDNGDVTEYCDAVFEMCYVEMCCYCAMLKCIRQSSCIAILPVLLVIYCNIIPQELK